MKARLGSRRDAIAALVGGGMAAVGWLVANLPMSPLSVAREPGWELAVFLRATRLPFREAIAVSELLVGALNLLVWMAVACATAALVGAISRAWNRSSFRWAALIALGATVIAQLATYDNYALVPGAFNVVRPGWELAPRIAPITSFVIDFRTPLGLFSYPDRLLTTILAMLFSIIFWSAVLYLVAVVFKRVTRKPVRHALGEDLVEVLILWWRRS